MSEKELKVLSIGIAHKLAQRASDVEDYEKMRAICEIAVSDPNIIGDANDYHNFAVVMSREDDYLSAYYIVVKGLQQFPYNSDLLADAIYYGSNCKKYEECVNHVNTLLSRPRSSWTWRAFSFLIDYFENCWDWKDSATEVEEGLNISLEISKDYQKYLPFEERSYLAEYNIRQNLAKIALDKNDIDGAANHTAKALELLKSTIYSGKYSAVQCSLKYAEAIFEQQAYEEVIEICEKALQFGEEHASARLGYLMYLSAQSREILLYKKVNNGSYEEDEVKQIYDEYIAALSDTGDSYRRDIARRVKILAAKSGVPAPSEIVSQKIQKDDLSELWKRISEMKAD